MGSPIDLQHFESATFGDRSLQREVLELFEGQAVKLLETIRATQGKMQAEAAHALKGAARGIGAFAVAAEAERIERGDSGALEALERRIAEAQNAAAALRAKT
jgi:HPt (histidine-containing phosphotransfer) domain-containing protein